MAGAAVAIRLAAASRRFLARRPPGRIHRRKAELAREEFLARPHALLLCHMPRRPAVSAEVPTAWRKWVAPESRRHPQASAVLAGWRGGGLPCRSPRRATRGLDRGQQARAAPPVPPGPAARKLRGGRRAVRPGDRDDHDP